MLLLVILFIVLQPGLFITIPPIGKNIFMTGKKSWLSILVHAIIFVALATYLLGVNEGFQLEKFKENLTLKDGTVKPAIMTLAIGEEYRKIWEPSLKSKEDYAKKHGYTYIKGGDEFLDKSKPISWSKVPFAIHTLSNSPDGMLFLFSDTDVMITNPDLRLEDHVLPLLPDDKDLLISIDAQGVKNAGNMLMRNSPWLRDFWTRVGQQTDLTNHAWWENAAIIRLLETNEMDISKTQVTDQHHIFNAYLTGKPGQRLWEPGSLLVHYAGIHGKEASIEAQAKTLKEIGKAT
jgi:hypothetical protein